MAPKKRFVTEYKANFKEHEVHQGLQRQKKIQNQDQILFSSPWPEQENQDIKPKEKTAADGLKRNSETSKQKENHGLRYKAGLAPSMSMQNKIRYLSEYQKQFEWKRPVDREAPILSAEKMIYGGQDGNPSRATKINLPKKTEYQLQFVKHPIMKSPEVKAKQYLDQDKALHLQVYSPVGHQDAKVAAGKPSKKSPPPIIQRKSMVFQSEYHANFKSPSKYDYVKGSWVGADPPQFHPPDEQSDSSNQAASSSWYQQVLELREKVRSYRSRAREGSHFLSLLKDLQKFEEETKNESKEEPSNLPAHTKSPKPRTKSPPSEPSRKLTPVNTNQPEQQEHLRNAIAEDPANKDERQREEKESFPLPARIATNHELFWDKSHTLPGPPLNKTHSFDNISNESTITNGSARNSADQPPVIKRQAWPEDHPVKHQQVIPPYYTSGSSMSGEQDDSRSDVTISEIDNQELTHNEKRVQATRKLFTGRREDHGHGRKDFGDDRKDIGDDREGVDDDRKLSSEIPFKEKPTQGTRKLFTGKRQDHVEGRKDMRYNRGDFGGDRQLIGENRDFIGNNRIISSFTSDDDESCDSHSSFVSHTSSVLSVEAMDKRRALASETLQRAKRRQAQL